MTSPARPPLLVVALGGNALSPPREGFSMRGERTAIDRAAVELADLARAGHRLLVVHGNGPQVGRLLEARDFGDPDSLDVHVAQTQGELGYLIAEALDRHLASSESIAVVTRALIDPEDPAFTHPTKPVGPILSHPPRGVSCAPAPDGGGWRRVVPSPRPIRVVEEAAIGVLLNTVHVVAGGGGGVPLASCNGGRLPRAAVIDKDWVAALLAVAFDAGALVFVTDVSHAFDGFGGRGQTQIDTMTAARARARLSAGVFGAGSMAPKVESAVGFAERTGRTATIAVLGEVGAALRGATGTRITP